jgi:Mg2+/citrate symporter
MGCSSTLHAPERIERVARERREQAGRERAIREQHEKEMRELIEQIKREKAERKARRKQWWLAMRKLISKEGLLIVVDIVPMTLFLASIVVLLIVIYSTI